jgi:ribose transport system ATP-binding protein
VLSDKNILELKNITKIYPGVVALNKVNVRIKEGEVRGLIGENGAGKSTLIKSLAGAHSPSDGEIIYDGVSYSHLEPSQSMELGIACIYQELQQVPYMNVTENIFLGRELRTKAGFVDLKREKKEAQKLLTDFGLNIDPDAELGLLGVGTRQMIEICKASHAHSRLVILDEPSAALSKTETIELFKIMNKLKSQGVTMIYISHRLEEIMEICDSLTVLRDGNLIHDEIPISEVTIDKMVTMMVGRDIKQKYPKEIFKRGEALLEVKNLTSNGVYENISFKAYAGELLGVSGLIGAGRTEVMRGLTGADKITSGEILINNKKVNIRNPQDSINSGIAFLTEDRKGQGLVLLQSVEFNITLVALNSYVKKGWLDLKASKNDSIKEVADLHIKVPTVETLASSLSGGNQQKVVLAKWLLTEAKIFIIDEPTRGIDVGAKVEVYNLINKLLEQGKAVIMVSSEMDECMGMSDRIIIMHEGKITGEVARKDFSEEIIMRAASGITE